MTTELEDPVASLANREWLDTQNTDQRRILDLQAVGLRYALSLGRFRYSNAEQALPEQYHDSWMVLIFVISGSQHYQIDGCGVDAHGGQGICIRPGETYSTGNQPEQRGDLAWLILKARPLPRGRVLGMSGEGVRTVFARLVDPSLPRVFQLPPEMKNIISSAFTAWSMKNGVLRTELLRHRITALILESALALERCAETPNYADKRILDSVRWFHENIDELSSAEDLVARAGIGISRNRFYDEFKRITGTTPGDYMLRARVGEAAKRLHEDPALSVTYVAIDLGFSSSQYFATVFRRYLGSSPSHWRKTGKFPPGWDFVR